MIVFYDLKGFILVRGPVGSEIEEFIQNIFLSYKQGMKSYVLVKRHANTLSVLEKSLRLKDIGEVGFCLMIEYCDSLFEDPRFAPLVIKAKDRNITILMFSNTSLHIPSGIMGLFDSIICFRVESKEDAEYLGSYMDLDENSCKELLCLNNEEYYMYHVEKSRYGDGHSVAYKCSNPKDLFRMSVDIKSIRSYYEKNIYGKWREGESVTYELLGDEPMLNEERISRNADNPYKVTGGKIVRVKITKDNRVTGFTIHVFLPEEKNRTKRLKGAPFIICMHPIEPKELALQNGYALIFIDIVQIATDDTSHKGAFYDLYPYCEDPESQTGVLMAWAWGASKIVDAVAAGIDREYNLDPNAAIVTGVSRWGKAAAVCGAFDDRIRMTVPVCSGAGGLALFSVISEGRTYDLSSIGGPKDYRYGKNEPFSCLQSEEERGWFCDNFLKFSSTDDLFVDQDDLLFLAMDKERYYFIVAAYTGEDWVNAPAMWECYRKANIKYAKEGLDDNLAIHFHIEGHAVIGEDMELIIQYFEHMYYGKDNGVDMEGLKTTAFAGQELGINVD